MKKTLVIAFVSLLAVLCWGKPAYANTVVVQNKTDRVIVVDVTFPGTFCRNDNNIYIAPGKHWQVGAGSCSVGSVNATMRDETGKIIHNCKSVRPDGAENFLVLGNSRDGCNVDRYAKPNTTIAVKNETNEEICAGGFGKNCNWIGRNLTTSFENVSQVQFKGHEKCRAHYMDGSCAKMQADSCVTSASGPGNYVFKGFNGGWCSLSKI